MEIVNNKRKYTEDQYKLCREYFNLTTFPPLMDDFEEDVKSFETCFKESIQWFEDWSTDTMNQLGSLLED